MTEAIGRRPVLRRLLGAALVARGLADIPRAAAAPKAATRLAFDTERSEDVALIFRKLAYSMDGELGFWHLTATRYGLLGSQLIPFWQMNIGRFFTVQDGPAHDYSVTQMGVAFYTDLASGELLRRFRNPLTRESIVIPYGAPRANRYAAPLVSRAEYEPMPSSLSRAPNAQAQGAELIRTGSLGPAWIEGDSVWVQQDHLLTVPPSAASSTVTRINDLTTYFGSLRDVADPTVTMPPAGHAFTDINDWPPWLGMGAEPGVYYSRGLGYKAFSYAEMPAIWRRLMEREYPSIARDPLKALMG